VWVCVVLSEEDRWLPSLLPLQMPLLLWAANDCMLLCCRTRLPLYYCVLHLTYSKLHAT